MAWVVFTDSFTFDYRPRKGASQTWQVSEEPQQVTHEVAEAAIKAGKAKKTKSPSSKTGQSRSKSAD